MPLDIILNDKAHKTDILHGCNKVQFNTYTYTENTVLLRVTWEQRKCHKSSCSLPWGFP